LETSGTAYILTQRHKPAWLESYITPLWKPQYVLATRGEVRIRLLFIKYRYSKQTKEGKMGRRDI
jgi:hypothetical protein